MRVCVRTCSTCQYACVPVYLTCQRAKSVPTSHFYVSTCHTAFHCFILACQREKWCANFSTWRANVPIFQTFLLRSAKENFSTLLLHNKFYILCDIIVIHIICICIINKNCIIFYLYTSCHIKEKCVEFFLFSFLLFS